jgi:Cu(I)/Ag(I) efflux system membrane fusion protein
MSTDATAVATVAFNDRDVAVVQARTGGFVERVYARAPGDVIAAGAPLADVLVTEWAGAQEEYLAVRATGDEELAAAARQRLLLLGMSAAQIEEIERSGKARAVMTIAAPIGGAIQELGVRAGMSVMPGSTLARINGLRTVWLEAAVPEAQAGVLAAGHAAEATFAAYPGEVFKGKIATVLPQANAETRTLRVRLEFPNPALRIRPGMFAQVRIQGPSREALVVPSDAVVRTGKRALVFVSSKPGVYRPVKIEIGQEMDGKVAVLSGLEEGQKVAASGQFLIDSEASLQGVIQRAEQDGGHDRATADAAPGYEAQGEITEIDGGEITLAHGAVPALQWPAMTMSFTLSKPELAQGVKPGDQVRFRFRETDDGYAVESLEKTGGAR